MASCLVYIGVLMCLIICVKNGLCLHIAVWLKGDLYYNALQIEDMELTSW